FITLFLKEFHDTMVGGHAGVNKTLKRLSANFYWALMAKDYLRAFVHDKLQHWFHYLPWVEFHYNTPVHSGSKMSPFQVMYGKPPPSIPEHLVHVKLQAYCEIYVSGSKFHKLAKRFYGPFQVTAKVGPVAYKLDLPDTSRIHNVFHCSVLKAYEGPLPPSIDPLTPLSYENNMLVTPLTILGFKTNNVNCVLKRLALMQWQGLSPDDTLWDDWITLQQIYDLEDKVIAKEWVGVILAVRSVGNTDMSNKGTESLGPGSLPCTTEIWW
ncbi:hypothetical protein V8G54_010304, partial [Vigna mungo]